jgi:hypothetical protein
VIQSSKEINPGITDYIKEKNIKFLPHVEGEDYADDYVRFYDSLT